MLRWVRFGAGVLVVSKDRTGLGQHPSEQGWVRSDEGVPRPAMYSWHARPGQHRALGPDKGSTAHPSDSTPGFAAQLGHSTLLCTFCFRTSALHSTSSVLNISRGAMRGTWQAGA